MLRIGLTGGIASGKSTVATLFAALGTDIIDTDRIARDVVAPGSPALNDIRERFGADMLTPAGELDRRKMRTLIFADDSKRRELEQILHPRIRKRALEHAAASKGPYVILVVPLLFETGFDRFVDRRLVVDCPETMQIERLTARDDATVEEARTALAAQIDRTERLALADDVIDNSGSLDATKAQVERLHAGYLELAQNCPHDEAHAE